MAVIGLLLAACASLEGLVGGADSPPPDDSGPATDGPVTDGPLDVGLTDASAPLYRPESGTYRYVGTGLDKLTRIDGGPLKEQLQGPVMDGVVAPLPRGDGGVADACYSFSLFASATHSWTLNLCQRGDRLVESSGQDEQVWVFGTLRNPNLASWRCTPENLILGPTLERDKQAPHLCEGQNTTPPDSGFRQGGLLKFLGREVLNVAGQDVSAIHVEVTRTVTGSTQQGTQALELWLDARSSLPLRGVRSSTVTTTAPFFGELRYTETSEFQIQSLDPVLPSSDASVDADGDAPKDGPRG